MESLYPLSDVPDNLNGWELARRLLAVERLSSDSLQQLQDCHFAHVVRHHGAYSPHFQDRLRKAGLVTEDLTRLRDITCLPPLHRAELQVAGADLYARLVPVDHLPMRTAKTSGSTGQPVEVRRTRLTDLLNEAVTVLDHHWWRRPLNGGLFTMIRPQFSRVAEVPASPGNTLNIAQKIPITLDVKEQANLIAAFHPQTLLVYPNNLAALLDIWAEGARPDRLRHVKTIGESVSDALRARTQAILGLSIEDGYSSEEMGAMALQCPASGQYHVMAELVHLEVIRDNGEACRSGEIGRLLVTDLHNLATPMIRYAIGDWAEVGTPCPCGRNLPTLKRILGRERNLVRLPDGRRHWPLVGFQRFGEVAPVRQYQVVQESLTDVELRLVVEGELTPAQSAALAQIVQSALGHPFHVRVTLFAERLPLGPNGKFEEFVCRVPANA